MVAFGAATSAPLFIESKRTQASSNKTSLLDGSFNVAIAMNASNSEL